PCSRRAPLLPSFPPRRSSDLSRRSNRIDLAPEHVRLEGIPPACRGRRRPFCPIRGADRPCDVVKGPKALFTPVRAGRTRPPTSRSEEHTSELQSRENLVCRLL